MRVPQMYQSYYPYIPNTYNQPPIHNETSIPHYIIPNNGQSLLEEFHNTEKTKKWQLSQIYKHCVEFAKDQQGSRFLQTGIEKATPEERTKIFDELAPKAFELITDVFGNYVIQKFFQFGTEEQKQILLKAIVFIYYNIDW